MDVNKMECLELPTRIYTCRMNISLQKAVGICIFIVYSCLSQADDLSVMSENFLAAIRMKEQRLFLGPSRN